MDARLELECIRIEKLLKACLRQLGKKQKNIEDDRKSAPWKLAIASHLKTSTGIKNPRLCAYLNLGHPATMSKLVGIYNHSGKDKCPYGRKLKTLNN